MSDPTATCYCGTVQLSFSLEGVVNRFICHCTDDRKITSSMFASNFIVKNDALTHERGQEKLTKFVKEEGIWSGGTMASHFCSVCGSLMYRIGSSYPGVTILRLGQVDDFGLVETTLRPRVEQYGKDRVEWVKPAEGVEQVDADYFKPKPKPKV